MYTKWRTFTAIVFMHLCFIAKSQTADLYLISSAGGFLTANNHSMNFAVGEIATETFSSNDLFITQGFLQTGNLSISIKEIIDLTEQILVYPNPTSDILKIDFMNYPDDQNIEYSIDIIDINGKHMYSNIINSKKIELNLSHYLSGMYFVKIHNLQYKESYVKVIQKIGA